MASTNWNSLKMLDRRAFNYPDSMHDSILTSLDLFSLQIDSVPLMLDDYRPGDPRQHGLGRAVDVTYPDRDSLFVWNAALDSQLFSGLGIYLNEAGAVSFHFDTRVDRTGENPARWGSFIEAQVNNYVGAGLVIDAIKKKGWLVLPLIGLVIWLLWRGKR